MRAAGKGGRGSPSTAKAAGLLAGAQEGRSPSPRGDCRWAACRELRSRAWALWRGCFKILIAGEGGMNEAVFDEEVREQRESKIVTHQPTPATQPRSPPTKSEPVGLPPRRAGPEPWPSRPRRRAAARGAAASTATPDQVEEEAGGGVANELARAASRPGSHDAESSRDMRGQSAGSDAPPRPGRRVSRRGCFKILTQGERE